MDETTKETFPPRGVDGWRAVALANQATAQSHQARWASAEALLQMALPHVETEGDDSLAEMIRQHLQHWPMRGNTDGAA